jgi:hypothetical protein
MQQLKCLTAFLVLATTLLGTALPTQGQIATVSLSATNLREKPTTSSAIVVALKKGDELEILEKSGDWYRARVRATGKEGYVNSAVVELVVPPVRPGAPVRPEAPAAGAPTGTLSVSSTPAGAAVYVDGQFVGQTPVNVPSLSDGDHRVRIVKDGYLENSRVVAVAAGKINPLLVRLTEGSMSGAGARGTGLKIVVLEGEGGINIIEKKTAVKPIVEVTDRNNLPVAGAAVVFSIGGGKSAFSNGARQLTATTDGLGRATVGELNPVGRGAFQIQVKATSQGQTATASIHQTNFATAVDAAQAAKAPGPGQGGQAVSSTGGGVGGGLSGAAIGGIVAGVGGAIATAAVVTNRDGTATPTPPPNRTPAVTAISAAPTVALLGANATIAFGAQASDPDSDQLTFLWDFGDGGTSTSQSPTHTYSAAGTFIARVTVSDGKASTTSQTSVTIRSLSGIWRTSVLPYADIGAATFQGTIQFTFTLTQTATSVVGPVQGVPTSCQFGSCPSYAGTTTGTVGTASPRVILTATQPGFEETVFRVDPSPDINTMTGFVGTLPVTFTRQ